MHRRKNSFFKLDDNKHDKQSSFVLDFRAIRIVCYFWIRPNTQTIIQCTQNGGTIEKKTTATTVTRTISWNVIFVLAYSIHLFSNMCVAFLANSIFVVDFFFVFFLIFHYYFVSVSHKYYTHTNIYYSMCLVSCLMPICFSFCICCVFVHTFLNCFIE